MPHLPAPHAQTPLSPRRRRLRWTIILLVLAAIGALLTGWWLYLQHRPRPYRPGEASTDITSELSANLPADAPAPQLRDVTTKAGLDGFRTFPGDRTSQLPEDMGPGVAWGDFNNDGNEDVFLVSGGGPLGVATGQLAPCQLYENQGDGRFRRVASFPDVRIHGMAAAWGDYDGDGHLDLVVSGYNALLLFHNEGGSGTFHRDKRFPNRKGFWSSVAWADYDNDRRPDLYVCNYVQYVEDEGNRDQMSSQLGTFVPYTLNPASYPAGTNLLLHNLGDGTFEDMGEKLGVANPTGRSLGALWHDFDDDGWLDLYIANDVSDNAFFHNNQGRFEDISHPVYVADYRSAMGLAAGDWNRDGDDDLFITHWVAQENAFYDNNRAELGLSTNTPGRIQDEARRKSAPPKPYGLSFMDVADMEGLGQIALPFVGWGTEFVDLDADGWLDLVVVNGSTLEMPSDRKKLQAQEAFLFWNRHGERFYNLASLQPLLAAPHVSRGMAVADYDNDGAMDLLISHFGEGVQLLRNEMQKGNWLKLRLRSRLASGAPLGFGEGAKLTAHLGDVPLRRSVTGASYLSQSTRVVHFGLGTAPAVDWLEVRWLGGGTNFYTNLTANSTYLLTEGEARARRIEPAKTPVASTGASPAATMSGTSSTDPRIRELEFWKNERAAMNAIKVETNYVKAIGLFKAAIALNPRHEDSLYYLGQCLAQQGDVAGALEQWAELVRINPKSHRGHQQWGCLKAMSAKSDDDLATAEEALEKAHTLNPEETGALLLLGEVSLLRGQFGKADDRLAAACRSNPRAVGGFFLRGYLAWQRGETAEAKALLAQARQALGKDWQPKGATSEGDVKQKAHRENTPLSRFWEEWDGSAEPDTVFRSLENFLARRRSEPSRGRSADR